MKKQNGRIQKRSKISVLVKCLPKKVPTQRNGHETLGWNMWASNLADDGVGLKWSRRWATANCSHCTKHANDVPKLRTCSPPHKTFKKGQKVHLEGLVYGDNGSEPMEGHVRWMKTSRDGETCEFGVWVTTPEHREYFRALQS